MSDLNKAFIELRRRIRDIPMEEAVSDNLFYKDIWGNVDKEETKKVINIVHSIIRIYREAIFARMDSVQETWNDE